MATLRHLWMSGGLVFLIVGLENTFVPGKGWGPLLTPYCREENYKWIQSGS